MGGGEDVDGGLVEGRVSENDRREGKYSSGRKMREKRKGKKEKKIRFTNSISRLESSATLNSPLHYLYEGYGKAIRKVKRDTPAPLLLLVMSSTSGPSSEAS